MTRRYDPKSKVRAAAHAKHSHICPRCFQTFMGNGYGNHKRACKSRQVLAIAEGLQR